VKTKQNTKTTKFVIFVWDRKEQQVTKKFENNNVCCNPTICSQKQKLQNL